MALLLLIYQYTYDKMDNITSKATEHGDYQYNYDDLYRLNTTDNPDFADEAFTYDAVGNRLTAADTTGDWSYNLNNELGGYDDVSYEYDANGNMTQKTVAGVVTKFFYNLEDRLERVEDGVGTVIAEYYYDPFGRRLWKDVGGVRTYFHYSDEGLVAEMDASGNVTKSYGYKPGSTWTTDPLFMKQGSDYYFYQNDNLGTPQKLTAINGAVVWAAKYSSFGKATVDGSSTITSNLRFPGQVYDAETGLHYNLHRYYDPTLGRYLNPDPIGFEGGINVYEYASQNPLVKIDPFGLKVIDGMNCKEIGRVVVPGIASGQPYHRKSIGTKTICTDIVIEDTMSCVCIGEQKEAFTEYYDNYVSWAVVYNCCPFGNECEVEGCKIVTKYESMKLKPREEEVYSPIPGGGRKIIEHGFTNSNAFSVNPKDRWCSKCPNGIGKPM